jgi:DNA-binding ferritin-like protein (Dps family)
MSRFEGYVMATINRSQIQNASYNPRKISKKNRDNLRKGLEAHKLVVPLTWNIRTGNLVSGHQRIKQLDEMEQSKNYELTVAQIDVGEKQEKEINILLNNQSAMGEFDIDILGGLLEEVDYGLAGFDDKSLEDVIGDLDADVLNDDDLQERSDNYDEGIAHRKRMQAASQKKNNIDYYSVLVFKDQLNRQEFFAVLGIKEEDYVDGNKVMEAFRGKLSRRQE